ncbi:helix-turn-helix domain-containing protein [Pediococcus pentosaceus]|nr:helix-turn-helix domain-containing protein [Pediococcus pentosaceus]
MFCKTRFTERSDNLKNRVREFRAKTNMNQSELAKKVEVTRQTISNIEHHGSVPSLVVAQRIAATFGVSVDDIFLSDLSYISYKNNKKGVTA